MGATINARMGLNTWAAFIGTNEKAAIAGDVAMLRKRGDARSESAAQERPRRRRHPSPHDRTEPTVFFLHYWGTGPAEKLAAGFKAASNELGKHGDAASR